jgi:hypothetical protein
LNTLPEAIADVKTAVAGVSPLEPADYGLDAPAVIRNLVIAVVVCLLLWGSAALGLWSGVIVGTVSTVKLVFPIAVSALWTAIGCGLMAVWMIWYSRFGKIRGRERLLDQIPWAGTEQVLDVGCGRGLMLIGAARRLITGTAVGVDIWQAEDLTGNRPEAALENARREGVADRVQVRTADMRQLPFPDRTFDVVVSCAAIHNLYSAADRDKAIREIARVLKPGGRAVIDDIRHHGEYAATFAAHGCPLVRRLGSRVVSGLLAVVTMGSLRPAKLIVRRAA